MSMLTVDLPARLRAAGLTVVTVDGWQSRGRPATTGGFAPAGVLWHHTGGTQDGLVFARWLFLTGRSDLPAPLCHLAVGRDGVVYLGAAGRANHAGKATASGPMAAGDGNRMYVGVECMNTGSEGWPTAQYKAMVRLGAVLSDVLGCSASAHRGHRETSVTGKWDPGLLDLDRFRSDIKHQRTAAPAPGGRPEDVRDLIRAARDVRDRAKKQGKPKLLARAKATLREWRKVGKR